MSRISRPPSRFQTDFGSVSGWLVGANKHLKAWSDLKQDCVHSRLIELLVRLMEMNRNVKA